MTRLVLVLAVLGAMSGAGCACRAAKVHKIKLVPSQDITCRGDVSKCTVFTPNPNNIITCTFDEFGFCTPQPAPK